jgi:sterol desaturase/sphingolipid hydroxylase (fatty acid hydroxylase superfamily)
MLETNIRARRPQRSLWSKLWRDRQGRIVIYQTPNIWLIAWMVLTFISLLSSSKTTANVFWWLGCGVLVIWSLLEIFRGANYFRRALGAVVLLITVAASFGIGL